MEDWLDKAWRMFSEFASEFETMLEMSDLSPSGIWIVLSPALTIAYDEEPINEDLIRRIYEYAAWCLGQPQTDSSETDVSSAAAVGLIEDIPLCSKAKNDLYR